MNERLFADFPPVATEEWEEQIRQDLRDAGRGDALLWRLPDGLTIRPYYRAEDVSRLATAVADEPVEMPIGWQLRQDIRTYELGSAAEHARAAADSGVGIVGIDLDMEDRSTDVPIRSTAEFERLFVGLANFDVALHLRGGAYSPSLFAFFLETFPGERPALTMAFDPVGASARRGRRLDHQLDLAADVLRAASEKDLRDTRVLSVASTPFHEAGATPVFEVALHLASLSETLVQMIDRGVHATETLGRLIIEAPVESAYFVEIARLRALRLCIRQLIGVFVPDERAPLPPIHGETSWRNQTLYDPHENLLRATTEAASAVIGGCDVVCVHPFDSAAGRPDAFSYRMARNIQHLLRHESGFGRVADPAAGSYYVEVMTDAIARRAWLLFQEIESEGGLFEALGSGFIHGRLEEALSEQRLAVAERRRVLVGTNHYPSPQPLGAAAPAEDADTIDRASPSAEPAWRSFTELRERVAAGLTISMPPKLLDGPPLAAPLSRERLAEAVEQRRLRIEQLDAPPRILILPFGDPVTRSTRADFAANFLGCGGFALETTLGIEHIEAIATVLHDNAADVLVCCAADDAYARLLPEVRRQLDSLTRRSIIGIVARPDVSDQLAGVLFDFTIHKGSNLLNLLDDIQARLGLAIRPSRKVPR